MKLLAYWMSAIVVIAVTLQRLQTKGYESYICESRNDTINCTRTPFTVLNIIYAGYGRTSADFCQDSQGNSTTCEPFNVTDIVRELCQNNDSCILAPSNTVFEDPCSGISKYLKVEYQCTSTEVFTTTAEPLETSLSTAFDIVTGSILSTPLSSTQSSTTQQNKHLSTLYDISNLLSAILSEDENTSFASGIPEYGSTFTTKDKFSITSTSPTLVSNSTTTPFVSAKKIYENFYDDPRHIAAVSAGAGLTGITLIAVFLYILFRHSNCGRVGSLLDVTEVQRSA